MAALIAALCIAAGALFDVESIPLGSQDARVFLAHADADSTADVFVLDASTLAIHSSAEEWKLKEVQLLEGTSALDVADVDGDGLNEVVAVCGERILRYTIPAGGDAAPSPAELFSHPTQLSDVAARPYLFVMAVKHEGRMALALPCEGRLELRAIDGTLLATYPTGSGAPQRMGSGRPFWTWSVNPPRVGPPNALELRVSHVLDSVPQLPEDLFPADTVETKRPRWTPPYARIETSAWPWFPIGSGDGSALRALCSLARPNYRDTIVRIRRSNIEEEDDDDVTIGPERRYPGAVVLLEDSLPDFNGDGYMDLLLWKAPRPGTSVDSLTRAVTGRDWPLTFTTHLFSPAKERYEPAPSSRAACTVPVIWFLTMSQQGPFRHCVLRDFDGDGHTDLGCASAPNRYAIWLYGGQGFREKPSFTRTFSSPLVSVAFQADLDGQGRASIGLRTEKALCLLYAAP